MYTYLQPRQHLHLINGTHQGSGSTKLYRARSRLYQRRFLRPKNHFKAFFDIYKIFTLLHRSEFKNSAEFIKHVAFLQCYFSNMSLFFFFFFSFFLFFFFSFVSHVTYVFNCYPKFSIFDEKIPDVQQFLRRRSSYSRFSIFLTFATNILNFSKIVFEYVLVVRK